MKIIVGMILGLVIGWFIGNMNRAVNNFTVTCPPTPKCEYEVDPAVKESFLACQDNTLTLFDSLSKARRELLECERRNYVCDEESKSWREKYVLYPCPSSSSFD